jgi:hypothetical protein
MKIAFLFLIYDTIWNEQIWYDFLSKVSTDQFSIYIHFKHDQKLQFFENFKLKNCIATKYCDISIVHAHNMLIQEALKDTSNYKFINLSQACIPLKEFEYIYNQLVSNNNSYFHLAPEEQCFPRCNSLFPKYRKEEIKKSSNWFILNREHAEFVIRGDVDNFSEVYCPEEHYFITSILNQFENNLILTKDKPEMATTFANWSDSDYFWASNSYLKTYYEIVEEELLYLWQSPCLFGRKFIKNCKVKNKENLQEYLKKLF